MQPFILIIENRLIPELTGSLLELEGIDVRYATDAESGLIMLTKIRPALVLMGLTLPVLSGLTLTRILKNDPDTKDIAIIALVDFASNDDFEKSLTEFDGHISFPIDKIAFSKKVRNFLEKKTDRNKEVKIN